MADESLNTNQPSTMNDAGGAAPPNTPATNPSNPMPNPMDAANKVNAGPQQQQDNSQPQQNGSPQQADAKSGFGSPVSTKDAAAATSANLKATSSTPTTPNPATQYAQSKGGFFRTLAESLAGGPHYQTTVDWQTGETKRTPVRLSRSEIGMAIALEAISGGLAGMGAKGPNHIGQAAQLGMRVGAQGVEARQENEAKDAQAQQENFKNRAAITNTNMQMAQHAMALSGADHATNQMNVDGYASTIKLLQSQGAVKDIVSEAQMHSMLQNQSLHITKDMVMPYQVVPQTDNNGNQVKGKYGEPLWETKYAIIDPQAKINLPPDVLKILVDNKVPGYVNGDGKAIDLPENLELRAHMVADGLEKANAIRIAQVAFDGYAGGHSNVMHGDTAPAKGEGATQNEVQTGTPMKKLFTDADGNVDYDKWADIITKHEGGKPGDRNVRNNNPGNLVNGPFTKSQPGYDGVEDKGTYAKFKTAEDGRNAMKAMLKRDIEGKWGDAPVSAYLNDVYVKGDSPEKVKGYADDILKAAGQTSGEQGNKVSLSDEFQKGTLSADDLKVFQRMGGIDAFTTGKPGEASQADKLAAQDKSGQIGESVSHIKTILNKIKPIDQVRTEREQAQLDLKEKSAEALAANKAGLEQKEQDRIDNMIQPPPGWSGADSDILNKPPPEAAEILKKQGVTIPSNLAGLMAIANGEADLKTYGQKTYKGTNKLAAGDALTFIRNFLSPKYNESDYGSMAEWNKQITSGKTGDPGGAVLNAGTAANHIDLLSQNIDALKNGNLQAWNKMANAFGVETGKSPAVTFKAITDMLNNELAKVVSGSAPHEAELTKLKDNLNAGMGPDQIGKVLDAYVNLMNGRISEIASRNKQILHRDLMVSPEVARVFGKRGLDVPGYGSAWRDNTGKVVGLTRDGKTFSMKF